MGRCQHSTPSSSGIDGCLFGFGEILENTNMESERIACLLSQNLGFESRHPANIEKQQQQQYSSIDLAAAPSAAMAASAAVAAEAAKKKKEKSLLKKYIYEYYLEQETSEAASLKPLRVG